MCLNKKNKKFKIITLKEMTDLSQFLLDCCRNGHIFGFVTDDGIGSFAIIEHYIQCNHDQININLRDNDKGRTALHWSVLHNNVRMINLLIDNFKDEIDINIKDYVFGYTVLIEAAFRGYIDTVKLLVDNFKDKIDINRQENMNGYTVIHQLCEGVYATSSDVDWHLKDANFFKNKDIDICKFLIDNFKDQIDITIEEAEGFTAFGLALDENKMHMAKLLMEHFKDFIDVNLLEKYNNKLLGLQEN